jgi:hypothetical protein
MKKMESKKILAIMCFILSVAFQVSAKEKIIESLWTDSPLKIDGSVSDWKDDPLSAEKKAKVDYAFRNDVDFLYVLFRFNDLKYLSTIEATGMTLWIDVLGKKKKNLGVNFTKKKISSEEYIRLLEQRQGSVSDEQKEKLHESAFEWGGLTDEIRENYMKGKTSRGSGSIGISEGGKGGGATSVGFSGASPRDLTALRKMTKKYSFWVDVRLARDEMR